MKQKKVDLFSILEDFKKWGNKIDKNKNSSTKNLFSKKCQNCGQSYDKNITTSFCSYDCFNKFFNK